jgi:hypothetical protein
MVEWSMSNRRLGWVMISGLGVFSGCCLAADPPSAQADPFVKCVTELSTEPEFAEIAAKLPLVDWNHISFAMKADKTLPTPKERNEISDWFDAREVCWKRSETFHQEKYPPEIVQLAKEGKTAVDAIGVDLYNRKITFGEANKRIQELGDGITARLIPIIKQYQADIAAQKAADERRAEEQRARAEQQRVTNTQLAIQEQAIADAREAQQENLRQQRAQLFLNYMQAMRPAPIQIPQPRPVYNTNCYSYGNSTNCTTH